MSINILAADGRLTVEASFRVSSAVLIGVSHLRKVMSPTSFKLTEVISKLI
jgi:hypothetical protein